MFNREDLQQIESHGLTLSQVEQQIENFRQGFPYLKIVRAASAGDGVQVLSEEEVASAVERYEKLSEELRVVKFVPASGAATRMFKELFEYINEDKRTAGIDKLLDNIEKFAFWPELSEYVMPDSPDEEIVEEIVVGGLGYGSKPKGLVTFHAYEDGARKAVEEHLVEGAMYARCGDEVYIHFTVSEEHKSGFWDVLAHTQPIYEERYGVKYNISFSVQKPSTDTIAVNPDNTPFRTDDGKLLFRPAGHGALIENLNDIEADIIFVKNIDNVTTDARRGDTIKYKKALAGVLLELQDQAFEYLKVLEVGGGEIETIAEFVEKKLCVKLPENYNSQILKQVLDRPIRVCGVMDSRERKFDLTKYTDPATGFISSKSSGGRELRAQELPGLWNGAMANWNTVLVEVPITTFSPVKVVQDLLRPEHQ